MDFPSEYTSNVYTVPIENIGQNDWEKTLLRLKEWIFLGDANVVERANQVRPMKEDASEKSLQALARRQRRIEGLQLFEKTKLNRSIGNNCKIPSFSPLFQLNHCN